MDSSMIGILFRHLLSAGTCRLLFVALLQSFASAKIHDNLLCFSFWVRRQNIEHIQAELALVFPFNTCGTACRQIGGSERENSI